MFLRQTINKWTRMKPPFKKGLFAVLLTFWGGTGNVSADSFFVSNQGKLHASAENVIIDEHEKDADGFFITYWDMDSDGFVGPRSGAYSSDFAMRVIKSSPQERSEIVAKWKRQGFSAQVVGSSGDTSTVSNVFITFDSPIGLSSYVYPFYYTRTYLEIVSSRQKRKIYFAEIAQFSIRGNTISLVLRDGENLSGDYAPPIYNKKPYQPKLYGVLYHENGRISNLELPFEKVKTVIFAEPE
jgi:hypothetical protein